MEKDSSTFMLIEFLNSDLKKMILGMSFSLAKRLLDIIYGGGFDYMLIVRNKNENINVMDIETYNEGDRVVPYCMVLYNENGFYWVYESLDKNIVGNFLNLLENSIIDEKILIYTHNINFDGYILIDYFKKEGIPWKWFVRKTNLYWLEFTFKGRLFRIRCSYKLTGTSVFKLGKMLDTPKGSFPYSFVSKDTLFYKGLLPEEKYFESRDDFLSFDSQKEFDLKWKSIIYCGIDAHIVYESLIQIFLIGDSNLIKKSYSFSSYSYKLFSKNHDKYKITKSPLLEDSKNYIENSYFGGRTEIFGNTRDSKILRFDFAGMYGRCMMEKFPIGKSYFSTPSDFKYPGIYTVSVKSDLKLPLLPLRVGKKTIYPNGSFTTTLPRDEFIYFIELGGKVEKIHSALLYESEDYVFKDIVETYTLVRKKGGFYNIFGKNVINGLYGSFALRDEGIEFFLIFSDDELDYLTEDRRLVYFSRFNNMILVGVKGKRRISEQRQLIYASLTASKSRILLNTNATEVSKFYKLLYLETDSIDVASKTDDRGKTIMDVTWQKVYNRGVYISPKYYFLDGERMRAKGVRHSKYTYDEVETAFYSNKDSLLFESQLAFKKKDFSLSQVYLDKNLSMSTYSKRIFSEDKLSTEALIVNFNE